MKNIKINENIDNSNNSQNDIQFVPITSNIAYSDSFFALPEKVFKYIEIEIKKHFDGIYGIRKINNLIKNCRLVYPFFVSRNQLNHSDNPEEKWNFNRKHIQNEFCMGRDAVNETLKTLKLIKLLSWSVPNKISSFAIYTVYGIKNTIKKITKKLKNRDEYEDSELDNILDDRDFSEKLKENYYKEIEKINQQPMPKIQHEDLFLQIIELFPTQNTYTKAKANFWNSFVEDLNENEVRNGILETLDYVEKNQTKFNPLDSEKSLDKFFEQIFVNCFTKSEYYKQAKNIS